MMWCRCFLILVVLNFRLAICGKRSGGNWKSKFQNFKEEVQQDLHNQSEELTSLKQRFEVITQKCHDITSGTPSNESLSADEYNGETQEMSVERLEKWITDSLNTLTTQVVHLTESINLLSDNSTLKTYKGLPMLHYELLERFRTVTYQLNDLTSRLDSLQGSMKNVRDTKGICFKN